MKDEDDSFRRQLVEALAQLDETLTISYPYPDSRRWPSWKIYNRKIYKGGTHHAVIQGANLYIRRLLEPAGRPQS